MPKLRKNKPRRKLVTCNTAPYSSHKNSLRDDFNNRCGYCDCADHYEGGSRNFQIDHFRPQKHFPQLLNNYDNLVYSCRYCNRAKWHKWFDGDGFIDPCSPAYDDNLYRNKSGQIKSDTANGKLIIRELQLNTKRHEYIWIIDKLEYQMRLLRICTKQPNDKKSELMDLILKVSEEYFKYIDIFRKTL